MTDAAIQGIDRETRIIKEPPERNRITGLFNASAKVEDEPMSELVAVSYPDVYRAGEVCATLQRLQREFLIEMEDAAYVTKEQDGRIKLHQTVPVMGVATGVGLS